jgi:glyoxylase I family protein
VNQTLRHFAEALGVDDSLYFRDPNGISLELYREELGLFNGESLLR